MIITEYHSTRADGTILNRTYSDAGFYIIQNGTGAKYTEAIDPMSMNRTYTESEELLPVEPEETEEAQNG